MIIEDLSLLSLSLLLQVTSTIAVVVVAVVFSIKCWGFDCYCHDASTPADAAGHVQAGCCHAELLQLMHGATTHAGKSECLSIEDSNAISHGLKLLALPG